jgi:V-type H+-transporting ATPase subunit E
MEKAREIKVKADEEFAIEKVRCSAKPLDAACRIDLLRFFPPEHSQAKLVKHEQQAIDAQYEKKRKGAETAQKMCALRLALDCIDLTAPRTVHNRRSQTSRA